VELERKKERGRCLVPRFYLVELQKNEKEKEERKSTKTREKGGGDTQRRAFTYSAC
jgi:hypothetical protein